MPVCTRCGHELGIGRFCTNCGHPVEARSPEAPDTTRHPLYADQHAAERTARSAALYADLYAEQPTHRYEDDHPTAVTGSHRAVGTTTRVWPVALAAVLALFVVGALGGWLLLGDDADGVDDADGFDAPVAGAEPSQQPAEEPTEESPRPSRTASPDQQPSDRGARPRDVAAEASVVVPATAEPNQDTEGNTVGYAGANLLDGVPETTWRMPGDGTGETLVITLESPTELRKVGIVNGYAKTAGPYDWYAGNRRVLVVTWAMDDGTVVEHELAETRDLQTLELTEPVTTETVTVTLVGVSAPGTGAERRDYTAISEVSLVGVPAAP